MAGSAPATDGPSCGALTVPTLALTMGECQNPV